MQRIHQVQVYSLPLQFLLCDEDIATATKEENLKQCNSLCLTGKEGSSGSDECKEGGQSKTDPSLQPCMKCLSEGCKCDKFIVLVHCQDCAPVNKCILSAINNETCKCWSTSYIRAALDPVYDGKLHKILLQTGISFLKMRGQICQFSETFKKKERKEEFSISVCHLTQYKARTRWIQNHPRGYQMFK